MLMNIIFLHEHSKQWMTVSFIVSINSPKKHIFSNMKGITNVFSITPYVFVHRKLLMHHDNAEYSTKPGYVRPMHK